MDHLSLENVFSLNLRGTLPYQFVYTFNLPAIHPEIHSFLFRIYYVLLLTVALLGTYAFMSSKSSVKVERPLLKIEVFIVMLFIVFALIYQLTDLRASRYLVLLSPPFFFLLSWGISKIHLTSENVLLKRTFSVWVLLFIAINIYSNAKLLAYETRGESLSRKGYSYHNPDLRCRTLEECNRVFQAFEDRLNKDEREEFSFSKGTHLAKMTVRGKITEKEAINILKKNPEGVRKFYFYRYGMMLVKKYKKNLEMAVRKIEMFKSTFPQDENLIYMELGFISLLHKVGIDDLLQFQVKLHKNGQEKLIPIVWRAIGAVVTHQIVDNGYGYGKIRSKAKT